METEVQSQAPPQAREGSQLPQRPRSRHSDLQPLTTTQIHAARQREMMTSYRSPISSPISALSLGSPTFRAARQYYREKQLPLSPVEESPTIRIPPLIQTQVLNPQDYPRRHSDSITPVRLSNRLSRVSVSSSRQQSPLASSPRTLAEESRLQLLDGVERGELARLGSIVTKRRPVERGKPVPGSRGKIPFQYTHDRLHSWGHAYLGNSATADAFVKAVHLRRPSKLDTASEKEKSSEQSTMKDLVREQNPMVILSDEASKLPDMTSTTKSNLTEKPLPPLPPQTPKLKPESDPDLVTIRARVIPASKERKPFLIQRQFNLRELRSNIPAFANTYEPIGIGNAGREIGRSKSLSARGRAAIGEVKMGRDGEGPGIGLEAGAQVGNGRSGGVMPIHIEYALHYLPILAALMLSGHIRKGDSIDLPLPHPEVWERVVGFVYRGMGEVSGAMREDILFLGGKVD